MDTPDWQAALDAMRRQYGIDEGAELHRSMTEEGVDFATVKATDDIGGLRGTRKRDREWLLAAAKRKRFLEVLARNPYDLKTAWEAMGWTVKVQEKVKKDGTPGRPIVTCPTYVKHRKADPRFAAEVDAMRGGRLGRPKRTERIEVLTARLEEAHDQLVEAGVRATPDAPLPPVAPEEVDEIGGFAGFRKRYFGMDTPWFHQQVVDVLEKAEPGSVTMILLPPEHGKTTLLEDWMSYKLALEPEYRIMVASEKQMHASKVLKRIKNRMDEHGPCPDYVDRFGPFVPQLGEDAHRTQAWNANYFDVWRRSNTDERDFNVCALGFGSAVAGTRCDLLVLDDVQSLKSINLTSSIVDEFRQDWLSRPGSLGKTVILGTRVGEGDFYEKVIEAELVDHLVKHAAVDGKGRWLWPERYSEVNYARMRRNVGEAAWARNYMQRPSAASERTFTDDHFKRATDPLHRFGEKPDHIDGLHTAVVGWDPGFGINAFYVGGITPERLVDLDWRTDHGLTSTAQMAQILRDLCHHWQGKGVRVGYVVIEDKAFQHGLLADEAILAVRDQFGFTISGHQTTGQSKLDEDLGVAAMARSFGAGEIVMPGADDPDTVRAVAAMQSELAAWRPNKRGAKLRQDLVMARWFAWMRWRSIRHLGVEDRSHVIRMSSAVVRPTTFKSLTMAGAR